MAFQIRDGDELPLAFGVVDRDGNPAAFEGEPQVSSSDDNLIAARYDAATNEVVGATVPGPGLGLATLTATIDADTGEGVTPVSATFEFEVIASDAVAINLAPGTPRPRAEAPVEPPVEPPAEPPVEPTP